MSLIAAYLNQTVSLARRTGSDAYGSPAWAAGTTVKARVQQRKRMVRNEAGEQVVSDLQVFLAPTVTVGEGDRITYSGGTYQVLAVSEEQGLSSTSHLVAWTGRVGDSA